MAGYKGYSMSNNAISAYESGEKPFSKWTKSQIIEAIIRANDSGGISLNMSISDLKRIPADLCKRHFLQCSSYHHTSKYYNRTDFYSVDFDAAEALTPEKVKELIAYFIIAEKVVPLSEPERWLCSFLEWSGTRKHPKATEVTEEGTISGNWFIRKDGSKKSITAKGFYKIRKLTNQ